MTDPCRVAMEEVVARVTEGLVGTRGAHDHCRAAAQIALVRCVRNFKVGTFQKLGIQDHCAVIWQLILLHTTHRI